MAPKLNILHTVEFYSPSVGGAQAAIQHISEELAKRNHQVTIATTNIKARKQKNINGVKVIGFDISGNEVWGFKGDIKKYQRFLLKSKFDIILNYAAQQWTTDLSFNILDKIKAKKILVPCGFPALCTPEYKQYFKKMSDCLKLYDWLIFLSNDYRDINYARQHRIKHFSVIPNGADQEEFLGVEKGKFRQKHHLKDKFIILTVGSHTGTKGHQECISAFKKAKIKNSTLVINGNIFGPTGCKKQCLQSARWHNLLNKQKIKILDLSRNELIQAFIDADLFLFASQIECSPLVLFEAMASSTPFITVPVGNAAEIIKWGKGGILTKAKIKNDMVFADILDFAQQIKKLYHNPKKRDKLAKNGFAAWQKKFTWKRIATQYEQLYLKLIQQ